MTKYIIIDDEPIAHRIIEKYCDNLPHLKKIGNCYNAFEAMQMINRNVYGSVFLTLLIAMAAASVGFVLFAALYMTGPAVEVFTGQWNG